MARMVLWVAVFLLFAATLLGAAVWAAHHCDVKLVQLELIRMWELAIFCRE